MSNAGYDLQLSEQQHTLYHSFLRVELWPVLLTILIPVHPNIKSAR